jgi:hypothetical protein
MLHEIPSTAHYAGGEMSDSTFNQADPIDMYQTGKQGSIDTGVKASLNAV